MTAHGTQARREIARLLETVGLPAGLGKDVEISGRDPIFPTPFRIGDAAAVTLGAFGAAVRQIWEDRGGRPQHIHIDTGAAGLATWAVEFQRQNGYRIQRPEPSYPTTNFFRTADDRFIFLHGGFPKLRDGLLSLLNCPNDAAAITAAVAQRTAESLEEAIIARGLTGTTARSAAEWLAHPQGKALAHLPVVEVTKIGDGDPMPLSRDGNRPLSGLRVADVTHVLAGPTCTRALASFGADVLHITFPTHPGIHVFDVDTGHGKRSAFCNLWDAGDKARMQALCTGADVLVESYRPGILDNAGFSAEAVAALRPGIIYVSVKCFGHVGPWAARPGWEQLAQACSGLAVGQGGADAPTLVPTYPNDYLTGYLAALGTLAALRRRATEGGSYSVRVALVRTAMWLQSFGTVAGTPLLPTVEDRERYARPYVWTEYGPYGALTYFGPGLVLSETPAYWERPALPLGAGPVAW